MDPLTENPAPALITAWPIGAALYGLERTAWFKAVRAGEVPTVKVHGRAYLIVAKAEVQLGRKITAADIERAAAIGEAKQEKIRATEQARLARKKSNSGPDSQGTRQSNTGVSDGERTTIK